MSMTQAPSLKNVSLTELHFKLLNGCGLAGKMWVWFGKCGCGLGCA